MTRRLGPPLDLMLEPHLPPRGHRPRGRPVPRALPRAWPSPARSPCPAPRRRWRPCVPMPVASWWSPASTPPTPGCTSSTWRSTSTSSRAGCGASARPTCCAARAPRSTSATTSTTSRAPWPPARPACRCSAAGPPARSCWPPAPTSCSTTWPSSRPGSTSTCSSSAPPPSRPTCAPAGSLLVAYSGGADSALLLAAAVRVLGADRVVAATGYSHSLPQAERDPAREFAESLGVRVLTPRDPRDGARGLPGQRRATGASSARPSCSTPWCRWPAEHGLAHVATGTNADDVVAGFRPGIRAAAERGALTPLADAGPDQGPGARGLAALGPADLGQAGRGLPVLAGSPTASRSPRTGWPGSSAPRARCARCWPGAGVAGARPAGARPGRGPRTHARASVEVDAALLGGPLAEGRALVDEVCAAVRRTGFATAELSRRGFRSGSMNELLAEPERWR